MTLHWVLDGVLLVALVRYVLANRFLKSSIVRYRAQHESDEQALADARDRWTHWENDPRSGTHGKSEAS